MGRHERNDNKKMPLMIKEKEKIEEKELMVKNLLDKYQKRAEGAEAALTEFKASLRSLLEMSDDELKAMCKEKNIKSFGKAAMKHKYVCAILNHLV